MPTNESLSNKPHSNTPSYFSSYSNPTIDYNNVSFEYNSNSAATYIQNIPTANVNVVSSMPIQNENYELKTPVSTKVNTVKTNATKSKC